MQQRVDVLRPTLSASAIFVRARWVPSVMFSVAVLASGCGEDGDGSGADTGILTTNTQLAQSTAPNTVPQSSGAQQPGQCVGVHPEGRYNGRVIQANAQSSSTGTQTATGIQSFTGTGTGSQGTGTGSQGMGTGSQGTGTGSQGTGTGSQGTGTGSGECEPPACIGDTSPFWELHDYQPLSCGYDQDYGFVDFLGKPVMVTFLAGWCSYCQSQAVGLEKLRIELTRAGHDFNLVIVNISSANTIEYRKLLLDRTSIPLFQDNEFTKLEEKHAAHKDEMFIYDSSGTLRDMFLHEGTRSSNLAAADGYSNVRDALLRVIAQDGAF